MFALLLWFLAAPAPANLEAARDAQNRTELVKISSELASAAGKQPSDANLLYRAAVAKSYLAEVALEVKDKGQAKNAAEEGIRLAEQAVALKPELAENHRILGTLCGQVIPANVLAGLRHGRCALDSISKAIEIDAKSPLAWLSKGIGNFYLPPAFGGGTDKAIGDLRHAATLGPKIAEIRMWLGIALREAGQNAEARLELKKAIALNPNRIWAKQQLEKTPEK